MTSFLASCPQCGIMGPKTGRCPSCGHSDCPEENLGTVSEATYEFAARYALHSRNRLIEMMITLALGFVGLITALMWGLVIYRGSIAALLLVGLLSVATAILTGVRFFSDRWFPTHLLCPSCDAHLEALNNIGNECPACNVILRVEAPEWDEAAEMAGAS